MDRSFPMPSPLHIAKCLATLLLCAGTSAFAAPVCPSKPISFAFFESGLLYSESSNDGIDKAVVDELARRSKCAFEPALKPRARIWLELERGDLMMTGSALRTDEREVYAWGVNYFGMKADLLVRNVSGNLPRSKEEFLKDESLKLGATKAFKHGDAMDDFIDELRRRNRVIDVPPGNNFEMLVRSRFDAMPTYPLDVIYRNKHDLTQFSLASDWFPSDKSPPRALLFSKKYFSREQVLEWRALVQQMRDDGTLKKIFTNYVGRDGADKLMQFAAEPP